jgi:hypothetical protein
VQPERASELLLDTFVDSPVAELEQDEVERVLDRDGSIPVENEL